MQGRPYEVKKFTKQSEGGRITYMRVGTACANNGSKQHMALLWMEYKTWRREGSRGD